MPLNDFLEPMFDVIKGNHKGLPLQVVDIVGVPLVGTLWH